MKEHKNYPLIEIYRKFEAEGAGDEYALFINNEACETLQRFLAHVDIFVLESMGFCPSHMPDMVHLVQIYDAILRRDDEEQLIGVT